MKGKDKDGKEKERQRKGNIMEGKGQEENILKFDICLEIYHYTSLLKVKTNSFDD